MNSRTAVSGNGSSHIYDDPDAYDLVASGLVTSDEQLYQQQQQQQLDPAHITIDAVVHRGITLLRKTVVRSSGIL